MDITGRSLERLAFAIDRHGIAAMEPSVAAVADRALVVGVSPVVVSVLANPAEPEVARARAFGIVATGLALGGDKPSTQAPAPPATQLVAS